MHICLYIYIYFRVWLAKLIRLEPKLTSIWQKERAVGHWRAYVIVLHGRMIRCCAGGAGRVQVAVNGHRQICAIHIFFKHIFMLNLYSCSSTFNFLKFGALIWKFLITKYVKLLKFEHDNWYMRVITVYSSTIICNRLIIVIFLLGFPLSATRRFRFSNSTASGRESDSSDDEWIWNCIQGCGDGSARCLKRLEMERCKGAC